jgi:post-segregation antitoxin (ccd killing protein)
MKSDEPEDRAAQSEAAERVREWLTENKSALADANEYLARYGLWSDGKRLF